MRILLAFTLLSGLALSADARERRYRFFHRRHVVACPCGGKCGVPKCNCGPAAKVKVTITRHKLKAEEASGLIPRPPQPCPKCKP